MRRDSGASLPRNMVSLVAAGALAAMLTPAHAADHGRLLLADLTDLSLEQLANIDITSV